MRQRFLLAAVILASFTSAVRSADKDAFVTELVSKAKGDGKSDDTVQRRAQAMDELGALGAKGLGSQVEAAVAGLGEVAEKPTVSPASPRIPIEATEFLKLHAVIALGRIGPKARAALPQIATTVGTDLTVDAAMNTAVALIAADDPGQQPPAAKTVPGPSAAEIQSYVNDLANKADAHARLAALKALADIKQTALPYFNTIADLMATDTDMDVRLVAADTTKALIDGLPAGTAPQITDTNTQIYLVKLAVMVQPKLPSVAGAQAADRNPVERVFAAKSISGLAKGPPANACALGQLVLLLKDTDPDVAGIAKNGLPPPK